MIIDRDITMALSYYAPYVSGLTEAARIVAEGLAAEGFRVSVVACKHDPSLPEREHINGVEVIRTPVRARIGRAVISPSFASTVARIGRTSRVLNIHLPLPDAAPIALQARHPRLVVTYQCDAADAGSVRQRLQAWLLDRSHSIALHRATTVVPSSRDYAVHSRLADLLVATNSVAIAPPTRHRRGAALFREGPGLHVGFVGRLVEEKGLPYLVDGFRALPDPHARLLIAGDPERVAGGTVMKQLHERINSDQRIRILGFLDDDAIGALYASLDVFAFPSINSFEAFGIAQVEAMRAGVPALASDLPGVREPVLRTGFGVIVPPRDALAITTALSSRPQQWGDPGWRSEKRALTSSLYSAERTIAEYRRAFGMKAR